MPPTNPGNPGGPGDLGGHPPIGPVLGEPGIDGPLPDGPPSRPNPGGPGPVLPIPGHPDIPAPEIVEDELLIQTEDQEISEGLLEILEQHDTEVLWTLGPQISTLKLNDPALREDLIRELAQTDEVVWIEYGFYQQPTADPPLVLTNDDLYVDQWGFNNDGIDINIQAAWDEGFTGQQFVINPDGSQGPRALAGVIDTGVDLTHPDLIFNTYINQGEIPADVVWVDTNGNSELDFYDLNDASNEGLVEDDNDNGFVDGLDLLGTDAFIDEVDGDSNLFLDDLLGWDFVDNDNNPQVDEFTSHGIHVAGTVGATPNNVLPTPNIGVAGVNRYPVLVHTRGGSDVFGLPTTATAGATAYLAELGAQVMNASYGGFFPSALGEAMIEYAGEFGANFVAAAGNFSINNDIFPFFPASYDVETIISVAALAQDGNPASFTHFGIESVDIAAPGQGIISTFPTPDPETGLNGISDANGSYAFNSGTSMAAPHVTGIVSLIRTYRPDFDAEDIALLLELTAQQLDSLEGLLPTAGLVDAHAALTAETFQLGELTAEPVSQDTVLLRWTGEFPALPDTPVQISTDGVTFTPVSTIGSSPVMTIGGLDPETSYSFRLGNSVVSTTIAEVTTMPVDPTLPGSDFFDDFNLEAPDPAYLIIDGEWEREQGIIRQGELSTQQIFPFDDEDLPEYRYNRIDTTLPTNFELSVKVRPDFLPDPDPFLGALPSVLPNPGSGFARAGISVVDPILANNYSLVFRKFEDGSTGISLLKTSDIDINTFVGYDSWLDGKPYSWNEDDWYHVKLSRIEGTLHAKVWPDDGSPEPEAFQLSTDDVMNTGGQISLLGGGNSRPIGIRNVDQSVDPEDLELIFINMIMPRTTFDELELTALPVRTIFGPDAPDPDTGGPGGPGIPGDPPTIPGPPPPPAKSPIYPGFRFGRGAGFGNGGGLGADAEEQSNSSYQFRMAASQARINQELPLLTGADNVDFDEDEKDERG